jgi:adenine-specific DNA-methyltransferase
MSTLELVDQTRRELTPHIAQTHKNMLGQFMTPASIARFMATMFPSSQQKTCRLLDAGAGIGTLSCAFLDLWLDGKLCFDSVEVTAYEIDLNLRRHLYQHLKQYEGIHLNIVDGDYIDLSSSKTRGEGVFTHAILNPPYKKINSKSLQRLALRRLGIETVNLYAAFVSLAIQQAAPGGQIVAIIPRSFCNGPYYRSFRQLILKHTAIQHIHLFTCRNKAFKDDNVLQENIIIRLECGGIQNNIKITTSSDDSFSNLMTQTHPFDQIVFPEDLENFIHIPTSSTQNALQSLTMVNCKLGDIGVRVSTGPVVDFRLKTHLRDMPTSNTVPLLYPGHFTKSGILWPNPKLKKPNAIVDNSETERWLYPKGNYCVVKRFSSNEEKRRVVASVVTSQMFDDVSKLGFENHLNIFHNNKVGLPLQLAHGLTSYLNTTYVDEFFRRFNGHTQVNATDLRQLPYPNCDYLMALGAWAMTQSVLTQDMIDDKLTSMTT